MWLSFSESFVERYLIGMDSTPGSCFLTSRLVCASANQERSSRTPLPQFITALQGCQRPEGILRGVTARREARYVLEEGEHLPLTQAGQRVRTRIEEEADRISFTSWPSLAPEDLNWLDSSLKKLADILSL
jgi:hypothetical protein